MQSSWSEFFQSDYMPHGHCYLWQPGILWTNVISDLAIAFAYFSIPFAMLYIINKRSSHSFKSISILFALFILSCGVTHLFAVYNIWHGEYGIHGIIKAITAGISVTTAVVLFANMDKLIAIPTPAELKLALEKGAEERIKRVNLELETRANSIFKFSVELFPTGVLVLDERKNILIANQKLEEIFGYRSDALTQQHITILFSPEQVNSLLKHSDQASDLYLANDGLSKVRLAWGVTKSGSTIPIEITISERDFEGKTYTFASIVNVNQVGVQKKQFLENSHRLQRAVNATDVGIWEWNLLTNKVWISPKLHALIDAPKSEPEMALEDWLSHIHPEDTALIKLAFENHIESKSEYNVEYRGKDSQHQYKWLRSKGDALFDESGKPILMSGTLTSIDQTKHLQLELESKNQFLDAVLEQVNSTVFIIDLINNKLSYSNSEITEIWGYTDAELKHIVVQKNVQTLLHPDDIYLYKRHLVKLKKSTLQTKYDLECRVKHKNGKWVWCLFKNAAYALNRKGVVKEILGSATDISEIKAREESNKLLAKKFSDTFEQAAVGIAHVGLDGSWLKVNGKICEILGYTREELIAKTFQNITHPDDLSDDEAQVQKLLNGESRYYTIEKRYIHKLGFPKWTRLTVSLVKSEDGTNNHFISVIEDISQQKQLEIDLTKSNEELEQFAYVASHDLKEPLRTMQTYTSYLIKDLASNNTKRVEQDKQFIDSASQRMTMLIDDLLRFSRVGSDQIQYTKVNVTELIREVIEDLATNIMETNTTIDLEQNDSIAYTDPVQVRFAVQNLIQNAIKFSNAESSPLISISVEKGANGDLLIHIKDNGIGIEREYQQQIFGLFKKLHGSDEFKGTGLGLAIVKKIMHRLGGSVSLESSPGKGSTFTLHLPQTK